MSRPRGHKKATRAIIPVRRRLVNALDVWITVFEFCDRETLASAARVWKAWEECAMRTLWRHLDDAIPLFKLLSNGVPRRSSVIRDELASSDSESESSSDSVQLHGMEGSGHEYWVCLSH